MRRLLLAALLLVGVLVSPHAVEAASITILRGQLGDTIPTQDLNQDTSSSARPGDSVSLVIVLDTDGLSFEGYSYDLEITLPGHVDGIGLVHASLPPLIPDLLGPPVVDDTADTVENINQGTLAGGLPQGVYAIDQLSFMISPDILVDGIREIRVSALLGPGDTFGLGGGIAAPTFFNQAVFVPEPTTVLLFGAGLLGLAYASPRRRA